MEVVSGLNVMVWGVDDMYSFPVLFIVKMKLDDFVDLDWTLLGIRAKR